MDYERLLYEKIEENLVKITLNRPEKRNAQDSLMIEEVRDAFIQADLDDDVRVIILGAAGKDFCAGHDQSGKGEKARGPYIGKALKTKMTGMEEHLRRDYYLDYLMGVTIRDVSKPTIAMVQGNCFGGGWIMASACDLIVASEDARFTDPLPKMAAAAATEVLFHPYDLGFRKAKEILWTSDAVTAWEGKQLGFISRVTPREKLEEETLNLAHKIAANPPVAVSLVKKSINHAWDEMGQRSAWEYHLLVHQLSHASDEAKQQQAKKASLMEKGGVKEFLKIKEQPG